MAHYVYILYSTHLDLFYIGSSQNPEERLVKHLANHKGFTGKTGDRILKYHETFETKTAAMKREAEIKGWKSRKLIEQLIGLEHPD